MQFDSSKIVPSPRAREEYLALSDALNAAETAYQNATGDVPSTEHDAAMEALRNERHENGMDYETYAARRQKLADEDEARCDALPEIAPLKAAMEAARKAFEDNPIPCDVYRNWEDNSARRCALSGVVLLDDDELLVDSTTDEYVLRALVLPPRPEIAEDDEGDDDLAEEEQAA